MAFSFLKPKPKAPPVVAARPRPGTPMPRVMVGNVGAPEPLHRPPNINDVDEASRQAMYKKLRRPPSATETRVGEVAMQWLLSLPKDVRPLECCKAYPHVVNHLAGWWDSPEALASYFDDLLHSRRKKRAGFPAPVQAEIQALFAHARGTGQIPLV